MTVENLLKLAKELGDAGDSQQSLYFLERARARMSKPKYAGLEIVGFELKKPEPKPKEKPKEVKQDGKKSKR